MVEFVLNRSKRTFSFNLPLEIEEARWIIGVTKFELLNSFCRKQKRTKKS